MPDAWVEAIRVHGYRLARVALSNALGPKSRLCGFQTDGSCCLALYHHFLNPPLQQRRSKLHQQCASILTALQP